MSEDQTPLLENRLITQISLIITVLIMVFGIFDVVPEISQLSLIDSIYFGLYLQIGRYALTVYDFQKSCELIEEELIDFLLLRIH